MSTMSGSTLPARVSRDLAVVAPVRPGRRAVGSRANYGVALAAVAGFMLVASVLVRNGYVSADVEAVLGAGAAQRGAGWLAETVLFMVTALPGDTVVHQLTLALLPAVAAGLLFGVLYHNVRDSDWGAPAAAALLVLLGGNALVLFTITSAGLVVPIFIASAALIPAIRRLESVGDVQADVSFGLVLPLLLLAGPATTPLILPLAVASAFSNADGRSDGRAFAAILLVAIMPTLIVIVSIGGFAARAGLDMADLIVPYIRAYSRLQFDGLGSGLLDLVVLAPVAAIPIAYCFVADRRRRRSSALAVVALPLYLAIGNSIFPWHLPQWVPAVALLSCFAAWIAVARVRRGFRIAALVLLAAAAVASWAMPGVIGDVAWQPALVADI